LLVDLNSKVGRKEYLRPTITSENSQEISGNDGVTVVNFAT
jgi:hypothetical protein